MRKITAVLLLAASAALGATKTLVKDKTSNECAQYIKFVHGTNVYYAGEIVFSSSQNPTSTRIIMDSNTNRLVICGGTSAG